MGFAVNFATSLKSIKLYDDIFKVYLIISEVLDDAFLFEQQ